MQAEPIEFIDFDALRKHVANYEALFHKLLLLFLEPAVFFLLRVRQSYRALSLP